MHAGARMNPDDIKPAERVERFKQLLIVVAVSAAGMLGYSRVLAPATSSPQIDAASWIGAFFLVAGVGGAALLRRTGCLDLAFANLCAAYALVCVLAAVFAPALTAIITTSSLVGAMVALDIEHKGLKRAILLLLGGAFAFSIAWADWMASAPSISPERAHHFNLVLDVIGVLVIVYVAFGYISRSRASMRQAQRSADDLCASREAYKRLNMELEEMVKDRTSRLASALENEATARRAAEKAADAREVFLSSMSHEIRTPLNALVATADLLQPDDVGANGSERVGIIKQSAEHLRDVIDNVLEYSALETKERTPELSTFSPDALLKQSMKIISEEARRKHLRLEVQWIGEPPEMLVSDPSWLRQMLVNCLHNAVKWTDEGSIQIVARVVESADRRLFHVIVADTGSAISLEHMTSVFEPFGNMGPSRRDKRQGNGLGLAVSKRLVDSLGGRISAENGSQRGAQFHLEIPVTMPADDLVARQQELGQLEVPLDQGFSAHYPLRIVVAEDDPLSARVVTMLLQKLGYAADVVGDGEELLRLLEGQRADLVLMDVHMPPGMDGLEATRRIQADWPEGERPTVFALTAGVLSEDDAKCRAVGMEVILHKPVTLEVLAGAIRDCHARRVERGGAKPCGA